MNRNYNLITAVLLSMLTLAASAQLSEKSIQELLSQRDEFIQQKRFEDASRLYTTNATVRISSMGNDSEISAKKYFSSFTNNTDEVKLQNHVTAPTSIEIRDDGKSARVESELQMAIIPPAESNQPCTFAFDESLAVTNTGSALKISSAVLTYKYHPEANELYRRVMSRLKEEGKIDPETAIAWLKEAGCFYDAGDGKRRKKTIGTKNYFNAGDEVAVLAAQIPGVQILWLNFLSDEGMKYVSKMSSLEALLVMHSEITDDGVAQLAACTNLSALSLSSPNLTDKALETIAAFPKITNLSFRGGPDADKGIVHLTHAAGLEQLTLYNVSAEDLHLLADLPNLQRLSIHSETITDKDLFHFENMKQLKSLTLYGSEATYEGAKQLKEKRPDLTLSPYEWANPCKGHLMNIEFAKGRWADKYEKENGAQPTSEDLDPFLKYAGGWEAMTCPEGGTISINPIGKGASCSIHGSMSAYSRRRNTSSRKGLSKEDFDTDGAVAGRWTMDVEAAKKLAAEKQLPILLNFTGSDWCYWCKLMEQNVFSQPDWKAYAVQNIVMVLIDFPRNSTAVPEKYKSRNNTLKDQYGIRGYPTFILLDPDGKTEIARLGAGQEKTAASFIKEIKAALKKEAPAR